MLKLYAAIPMLLMLPASLWAGDDLGAKKAAAVTSADEIINMRSSLAQAFIRPDTEITVLSYLS